MWRALMPDLPKYFWLGKGYALNPQDLYLSAQAARFGRAPDYVAAMAAGDYHNGPLSTYIPLGIFGLLAFIAFLVASLRALYLNYRYGPQELKVLNRFLFAYFLGYTIFFFTVFGGFSGELFRFTGTVAFSLALNRGICRKPSAWELARVPSRNAPAGALPSPA
jgi:O-antigen ligase